MDLRYWSWLYFACMIAAATTQLDPCYLWPGSVYVNGKCFLVLSERGHFQMAKDKCTQGRHGVVAEVRTQEEKNVLMSLMAPTKKFVFIGITDQINEGTYVWNSDKVPLKLSATVWDILCQNVNVDVADCVMMYLDGTLSCIDCVWKDMAIACQHDAVNPCDFYLPGAEYYAGSCFLYAQNSSGFDGQVFCEEKGAFLVEPKTKELMAYIKGFSNRQTVLSNKDTTIRIGGVALLPGDWTWVTSGEPITLQAWSSYEPDQLDRSGAIVMVKNDSWSWSNVEHHANMSLICQREIGDPCEEDLPGGVFRSGSCFKYYTSQLTWRSAMAACIDHGGFLAEPKTQEVSDSLIKYYSSVVGKSSDSVWLGGTDEPDGRWRWATSGEAVAYVAWNPNEPNSARDLLGSENVMVLSPNGSAAGWNDVSENHLWGYMCQTVLSNRSNQSYLVVLPSPGVNTTEDVVVYVTTGFQSHQVYLKFMTSSGRTLRTSVSNSKHREFIVKKEDRYLDSTDLRPGYVLIEASNTVSVVMFMNTSMTLIYSMSMARGDPHELSHFVYFGLNGNNFSSSLAVTSLTSRSNDVTLHLTKGSNNVKLDVNQAAVNLRYPSTISAVLNHWFHTLSIRVMTSSGGVFVDSVHPVVLYVDYHKEDAKTRLTYHAYNQVLPVSLLGHEYVMFPDLLSEDGSRTMLNVVAVRDDTRIMIHGAKMGTGPQQISLTLAGDAMTVSLASTDFYFVNSSETFYAGWFTGADDALLSQSCMTPLLPTSLWRKQYDFTMDFAASLVEAVSHVVVVVDTRLASTVQLLPLSDSWTCVAIPGTKWSGCYQELTTDNSSTYYHVQLKNHTAPFAAYLLSRNKQISVCYPLGISTKPQSISNFDKEAYLQSLKDPTPCSFSSTTSSNLLGTVDAYTTITEDFTESTPQEVLQTTSESTHLPTSVTTESTTNKTVMTAVATTTAATAIIITSTTTAATLSQGPATASIYNEAEFKLELAKLHIDRKDTLFYKRSKYSIEDLRLSAAAIGLVSMTSVVTAISVVIASDVVNFCRNSAKYGCCRTRKLKP